MGLVRQRLSPSHTFTLTKRVARGLQFRAAVLGFRGRRADVMMVS